MDMEQDAEYIIAVDPGRQKYGVAVMRQNGALMLKGIIPAEEIVEQVTDLVRRFSPAVVVTGDRTGSGKFVGLVEAAGLPIRGIETIDEHLTSQEGRRRYLTARREQGGLIHKILPLGLQTPDRAYDDHVAVILAERFLSRKSKN
ncbi:MAG: pre-16S rRNA-processing nuclease YqgF [Firmicutes bacterium]|nr:pre-16S rRNA-processing nuclease YqgF [Bacillota bacterium]